MENGGQCIVLWTLTITVPTFTLHSLGMSNQPKTFYLCETLDILCLPFYAFVWSHRGNVNVYLLCYYYVFAIELYSISFLCQKINTGDLETLSHFGF